MNILATLVYFKKDEDNLLTADSHFDLAYIREYLANKGINTTQYTQHNLKLFHDLLDDIIASGNHIIIFYIDEKNNDITEMITQKLKETNPHFTIIWIGFVSRNYIDFISKHCSPDILITDKLAENLHRKLTGINSAFHSDGIVHLEDKNQYSSILQNQFIIKPASPYQTENIPVEQANLYGVRLNQQNLNGSLELNSNFVKNQIVNDFDMYHSQGGGGIIPFLDSDILSNSELFNDFVKSMKNKSYAFSFFGRVSFNKLKVAIVDELINVKFSQLEIQINESDYQDATFKITSLYETFNKHGIDIKYVIKLPKIESKEKQDLLIDLLNILKSLHQLTGRVRFVSYNISKKSGSNSAFFQYKYPSYLVDYLVSQEDQQNMSQHYDGALLNGYIAYLTGYYPFGFTGGNSKHVGVKTKQLDSATNSALSNFLGINSAIIYNSDQEFETSKEEILYNMDDYMLREKNDVFENRIDEARKNGTFLPHYHQVYKTDEKYVEKLYIDNIHHSAHINILKNSYNDANDSRLIDDYNYLSINSQQDLDKFLFDVENYIKTGQFTNMYEVSSLLIDGCRWGGTGHCALSKLHRFNLDKDQNILPCGGCSRAIGKITGSYINAVSNAIQISEEEQELRGCSSCPVKDNCSKCAMIPDFMTSDQYCTIRRKYQYIDEYIEASNLIKYMLQNISMFKGANIRNIKITTKYKSHIISDNIEQKDDSYIKGHIYLLFMGKTPIIVESRSFKMLKINSIVAMILEGLIKGVSNESIIEIIRKKCEVNSDQAQKVFKNTVYKLLELNYIDKKVVSVLI